MKARGIMFTGLMMLLFVSSAALASDFDWLPDLNISAEADPSGFRAQLAARTAPAKARGGAHSQRAWASNRDHRSSTP
jgi:hypothetical protein